MDKILDYLNKHGDCLDTEISVGTRIPITKVQQHLIELMEQGEVITCHATRYVESVKSEVTICRLLPKANAARHSRRSGKAT